MRLTMIKLKRFLTLCLAFLLLVFCLSACETAEAEKIDDDRIVVAKIETEVGAYRIMFVDKETGVVYLFVKDGYGGGLTVMVDENGKPLIWEGEPND